MSYNGHPQNLATSDGKNAFASDTSSKYTPRFSAATQMILERIQSGNSTSFSSIGITTSTPPLPGYEDMRRSVLRSMRTTINMDIPSTPIGGKRPSINPSKPASASGSGTTPTALSASSTKSKGVAKTKSRGSGKRRRIKDESEDSEDSDGNISKLGGDSDSDDSEEVTEFPKITQSGRQIVKPTQFVPATYENPPKRRALSRKVREQALCKRCGRGHSLENNLIVFCDGCNLPWHQRCHDPVISNAAVQNERSTWYCGECSRKRGIKSGYDLSLKGVSWVGRSIEDKKAHLSSLSQSQLVSLLLQATNLYPDIPIFPATTFVKTSTSCAQTPHVFNSSTVSTAGLFTRSEANPSAPMNFIRKIQSPAPNAAMSTSQISSVPPTMQSSNREESRESTPASPPYPRPGNGLMANLGPDEEDLDWLVDGDDYETFSHSVYETSAISANRVGIEDVPVVNGRARIRGMGIGA